MTLGGFSLLVTLTVFWSFSWERVGTQHVHVLLLSSYSGGEQRLREPGYSQCVLKSSLGTTWDLLGNAQSWALPQTF